MSWQAHRTRTYADTLTHPRNPPRFSPAADKWAPHMRSKNWSSTPLGSPEGWSQSLKTVVRIILDSRYAMWMGWGPDLTFFYNDAYARDTLGKKHPWALGQPAREVWAEIWPDIAPRIERVLTSGQATWDEGLLLFLERNGYPEETYHTFSYSPLYDEHGQMGGMLCVVTEETERVISERRVALLRDLAAALNTAKTEADVFTAVEGIVQSDGRDLPFTLTFLAADKADGYILASSTGIDRTHPACATDAIWPLQQVINSSEPSPLDDLSNCFNDLPPRPPPKAPTRALLVPIAQQGQARRGVFIAGLNPHRPLDESYRGFINLFVGQITAALANARAYEEERRRAEALAELDRAKTIFFSNVSHEFRTPLTLMLGPLVDTLAQQNGALPTLAAEELKVVHRNGLRLLKQVNKLLDFSRIEAGRVQASFVPTDLSAFTSELASVFRSAIERAGMKLTIDAPPLASSAFVDREMWEKIVLNLLSNAFKFTFDGGITVRLREENHEILLCVEDTGTGIPEHELPRLFERFHRIEGTRARTHEGSGIGLALVHELVKIHGGKVSATSRPGQGTAFTVAAPRRQSPFAPRPGLGSEKQDFHRRRLQCLCRRSHPLAPRLRPARPRFQPLPYRWPTGAHLRTRLRLPGQHRRVLIRPRPRVLVADDNADMRDYVRRLLSDRYEVQVASDGAQALDIARTSAPALIVSDVMMPNVDGFELLKSVRADPTLAGIPVVLLSARAGEEATLDGIRAGADDYVVKPFSARELIARVDNLIQRKKFERRLADTEQRLQATLAAAKMAAWEWDPKTDLVSASETAADVYGLLPGQFLRDSKFGFTLIHPDDLDRHQQIVRRAGQRGEGFISEFRIIRPRTAASPGSTNAATPSKTPQPAARFSSDWLLTSPSARKPSSPSSTAKNAPASSSASTTPSACRPTRTRWPNPQHMCWPSISNATEHSTSKLTPTRTTAPSPASTPRTWRASRGVTAYRNSAQTTSPPSAPTSPTSKTTPPDPHFRRSNVTSSPPFRSAHSSLRLFSRKAGSWRCSSSTTRPRALDGLRDRRRLARRQPLLGIHRARPHRPQPCAESEERPPALRSNPPSWAPSTARCPWARSSGTPSARSTSGFLPRPRSISTYSTPSSTPRTAPASARQSSEPCIMANPTTSSTAQSPDWTRVRWVRAKGRAYYDPAGAPPRLRRRYSRTSPSFKAAEQRPRDATRLRAKCPRGSRARQPDEEDEFLATLSHELRTPLNAILGWSQIYSTPASSIPMMPGRAWTPSNATPVAQNSDD